MPKNKNKKKKTTMTTASATDDSDNDDEEEEEAMILFVSRSILSCPIITRTVRIRFKYVECLRQWPAGWVIG